MPYDLKYNPFEVLLFKREICASKIDPKFKCIRYDSGGSYSGGSGGDK